MDPIFSIPYLPPISCILRIASSDEIVIEAHEHFVKQTYRNRCYIYGPNGKQLLVIPVSHDDLFRKPITGVKISFDSRWNMIHWKSLCTAYRNSPYFEFFEDDFRKIYLYPSQSLFEFNLSLLKMILDFFEIKTIVRFTETYEPETGSIDLRNYFHPKNNHTMIHEYHQVFKERFGFITDLSCIDLLFNAGPFAIKEYLKKF